MLEQSRGRPRSGLTAPPGEEKLQEQPRTGAPSWTLTIGVGTREAWLDEGAASGCAAAAAEIIGVVFGVL
jgi:hypothetical protein